MQRACPRKSGGWRGARIHDDHNRGIIATTLADLRRPQAHAQFARHPLLAPFGLPMLPWFDALTGGLRPLVLEHEGDQK